MPYGKVGFVSGFVANDPDRSLVIDFTERRTQFIDDTLSLVGVPDGIVYSQLESKKATVAIFGCPDGLDRFPLWEFAPFVIGNL